MSYVRFSEADVYVYSDVGGYLCCCGCLLKEPWEHYSTDSMLAHLCKHKEAGHDVPSHVFEDLEADRVENEAFIAHIKNGGTYEDFDREAAPHA